MYHPAAALRSPSVERDSVDDMARVPDVLVRSRELRASHQIAPDRDGTPGTPGPARPTMGLDTASSGPAAPDHRNAAGPAAEPVADDASQLTLF